MYTKHHVDFEQLPWLSSLQHQLDLEAVALGLIRLPKGEGYYFTHQHTDQEEVYIVVEGSGVILIDGEFIDIERGDLVRVAPSAKRALKAGEENELFVICAGAVKGAFPKDPGARYLIDDGVPDYDDIPAWAAGKPEVVQKNAELKARMERSRSKRDES